MIIRTAKEADMPNLLDIYNYEVRKGTATFDVNPKTLEERWEWFYAHNVDNHPLIVAEVDSRVVGYASLSPYREKEAYAATVELSVYIDCAYRNRGIAGKLMEEILSMAAKRDDIHTVISVITGGNDASIHLHKKLGFVPCGTIWEVGEKFGCLLNIENYQLIL